MKKIVFSEEQKKEMKFLTSLKSSTGWLLSCSMLSIVLTVIGLFCPIYYYNPTVLEELKRKIYLSDLGLLGTLIDLFSLGIFVFFCLSFIKLPSWRKGIKKLQIYAAICEIFALATLIAVAAGSFSYEIPEEPFAYLELKLSVGGYFILLGTVMSASMLCCVAYMLKRITRGQSSIEDLAVNEKSKIKDNTQKEEDNSLTKKLNELKKLKDENIITEEEFNAKKEELLNKYQ